MDINFSNDIILENDHVLLRPLTTNDFEHLLYFSINEPDLWTYSLTRADGKENLQNYMQMAIADREANKSYPFVVVDKRTNQVCGSTRFYDFQPIHETIQLGYTWFGKAFQGTGINRNCKLLMLTHAFEEWNIQRVEFRADFQNKKSIAAMKNIGCVEEGVLRSNCASPTDRRDSIILSILRTEWLDEKKQQLVQKIR